MKCTIQDSGLFYTLVSDDSEELKFAINRQRFLADQGYDYMIEDWWYFTGRRP